MLPVFDGKLLVCTHETSTITTLQTDSRKFKEVKPSPFGFLADEIEVQGVTLLENKIIFPAMATIAFSTNRGLFICILYDDGHIDLYEEPIFLDHHTVTSANVIQGDNLFVTYKSEFECHIEDVVLKHDMTIPNLAERKSIIMTDPVIKSISRK